MKKRDAVILIVGISSLILSLVFYGISGVLAIRTFGTTGGWDGVKKWFKDAGHDISMGLVHVEESDKVSVNDDGIFVNDGDDKVVIDKNGIAVSDSDNKVVIDKSGIHINSDDGDLEVEVTETTEG